MLITLNAESAHMMTKHMSVEFRFEIPNYCRNKTEQISWAYFSPHPVDDRR